MFWRVSSPTRNKKEKEKMKGLLKIIGIVAGIIFVFLMILIIIGDKKPEKIEELNAKNGESVSLYQGVPNDVETALFKTIREFDDTANIKSERMEWSYQEYDDGVIVGYIPVVECYSKTYHQTYDYGCTFMMEYKDDEHSKFYVHYLKVGPNEYVHDSVWDNPKYDN